MAQASVTIYPQCASRKSAKAGRFTGHLKGLLHPLEEDPHAQLLGRQGLLLDVVARDRFGRREVGCVALFTHPSAANTVLRFGVGEDRGELDIFLVMEEGFWLTATGVKDETRRKIGESTAPGEWGWSPPAPFFPLACFLPGMLCMVVWV